MTAITVNALYQVVHEATVYGPGQTVEVPEEVATTWIEAGWVSVAKEPEKRASRPAKQR